MKIRNYIRSLAAGVMGLIAAYTSGCCSFPVDNGQGYIKVVTPGGVVRYVPDPSAELDYSKVSQADKIVTKMPSGKEFEIRDNSPKLRMSPATKTNYPALPVLSTNAVLKQESILSDFTRTNVLASNLERNLNADIKSTIPTNAVYSAPKSEYPASTNAPKIDVNQMTRDYLAEKPIPPLMGYAGKKSSGLETSVTMDDNGKPKYTIFYCAPSFKEFFNGIAMPFTLYRENKATGKTEILPAYTRPIRSGGFLAPEAGLVAYGINGVGKLCGAKGQLVYNSWEDNPQLNWGIFIDQVAASLLFCGGSGGSSGGQKQEEKKEKPKEEPCEGTTIIIDGGNGGN